VKFADGIYSAAQDADALLILSDWEEFAALDLKRLHSRLRYPIIIDGRNLYDPELMADRGFMYFSIGRPDVMPQRRAEPKLKKSA
jgi:UDPglucose 6-dehydrogenase